MRRGRGAERARGCPPLWAVAGRGSASRGDRGREKATERGAHTPRFHHRHDELPRHSDYDRAGDLGLACRDLAGRGFRQSVSRRRREVRDDTWAGANTARAAAQSERRREAASHHEGDDPITIGKLERGFLNLLRRAGLPLPVTNRRAGSRRVDCRWPQVRLTVELDGYRYHTSRHAWERDRQREREARARGDEFRRYTWADVYEEPAATVAELRRLLRGGG